MNRVERIVFSDKPLVIGHRGYCARAPENTKPSFELAIRAGADLVELDYQQTRDGKLVVIHDKTADRTTDCRRVLRKRRIRISELDAKDICRFDAGSWFGREFTGAKVLNLEEALGFILRRGGIPVIERKSGTAQAILKLLRSRGWVRRVVVIAFDWQFIRELQAMEPRLILGVLGPPEKLADGRKRRRVFAKAGAALPEEIAKAGAGLCVWNSRIDRRAIRALHEAGIPVWVYTVNNRRMGRKLLARGVDGIITNRIRELRQIMPV